MTRDYLITRDTHTDQLTFGRLTCPTDPAFALEILEENYDPKTATVSGSDDAIAPGRYRYTVEKHKQHGYCARLHAVPGRLGVLFHVGNWTTDTEGCILPGLRRTKTGVADSRAAIVRWLCHASGSASPVDWVKAAGYIEIKGSGVKA